MNTQKISILVTEPMATEGLTLLNNNQSFCVDVCLELSPDELMQKIANYDCLLVRSQTKVNASLINQGKRLKLIGRAGVGIDNIDISQAQKNHIAVINTPSGNSISTAELAFALMLSLARKLPFAHQHVREGNWDRGSFKGKELYQKTLGIIGFGNVGQNLARRALAFDMRVIVCDPLTDPLRVPSGVQVVSLSELLPQVDFLSLHCVLNDSTKNIINQQHIGLMKKGAMIINTARGELVEDAALIAGLDSGHIAFAALDVFRKEPPAQHDPLIDHPKIMVSPHLGASTEEAQKRVSNQLAEQTIAFFMGKDVTRVV
jgi:D-3-phosphoglycerate dehydrogenase / 2-oxoglutarate reductase